MSLEYTPQAVRDARLKFEREKRKKRHQAKMAGFPAARAAADAALKAKPHPSCQRDRHGKPLTLADYVDFLKQWGGMTGQEKALRLCLAEAKSAVSA